ncbi:DUF3971 domain-containing protein [Helicobacter sp.]|uniref:DUF3971 domain-containing protein n=1 Tax=Helicobacter sp. TaxID=218 RepID=UPI0025BB5842|nr:DUF3971 domain-containing protein [Helicobacter sp.]
MIKIKSKSIVSIVIFLGIVLTLSIMGYKILSNGIYSQSMSFGKIQVQGFYLRLNNKFILHIDTLNLTALQSTDTTSQEDDEDDAPMSADEILGWVKRFLLVLSYFEKLDIEQIVFADNLPRSVHYDGKEYFINFPKLIARFAIEENDKATELHITQLDILPFGLQMQGRLFYRGARKAIEADVSISPKESTDDKEQPTLYVRAVTDFSKIALEASSSHLYDLDALKPFILKLKNQTLNDWLFKKVHYDVLKLHSLRFKSTLDKHFFEKLQKTLELDLAIESPKIYLAENLKPIEATRVILYIRNESLRFLLKEPFFTDINLEGSEVAINNIFTQPLGVKVSVLSQNAHINDALSNLLQVFGVNLPLRSADSALQVKLDIDIQNEKDQTRVWLNGGISAAHTTFKIGNQNLETEQLQLIFAQDKTKAYMQILSTKIDYAKSIQGTLNLLWNMQNDKLQGNFIIDKFVLTSQSFSEKVNVPKIPKGSDELTKRIIKAIYEESQKGFSEAILKIDKNKMKKINIVGDMGKQKVITLPDFGLIIRIGEESIFELSDIAKIYAYSPILQYFGISQGTLKVQSKDFDTIYLNGNVHNLTYPLYDKNGKILSALSLEGRINEHGIFIGTNERKFALIKEGNVVKIILNGYDLHIDEVFSSQIPVLKQINQENESGEKLSPKEREEREAFIRAKRRYERENKLSPHITYLEARNIDFHLGGYVIPADNASFSLRDDMIRADVVYGNGVANVDMAYSRADVRLSNFSDKFLNRVWQSDIFDGGLFNFKGVYDEGTLKGEISMQNTTYKNLVIVQNILALIDTVPALLTFRKPGLGANGYEIKKGKVDFVLNDQYLVLDNINLIGSSIDVEGGGLVNLKNRELDVVLKASTLKTLADIVDKIPLVGYVILGDDGKFSTGIVMKGTLDDPKSEVSVFKDILTSPFEMVGRILKPVDNLLNGLVEAIGADVGGRAEGFDMLNSPALEKDNELSSLPKEQANLPSANSKNEDVNDENVVNEPNLPQQE